MASQTRNKRIMVMFDAFEDIAENAVGKQFNVYGMFTLGSGVLIFKNRNYDIPGSRDTDIHFVEQMFKVLARQAFKEAGLPASTRIMYNTQVITREYSRNNEPEENAKIRIFITSGEYEEEGDKHIEYMLKESKDIAGVPASDNFFASGKIYKDGADRELMIKKIMREMPTIPGTDDHNAIKAEVKKQLQIIELLEKWQT